MPRASSRDSRLVDRMVEDVVNSYVNTIPLSVTCNNKRIQTNGMDMRPSALLNPPVVHVGGVDFRHFYTLVMVDPDAPTPSNPTQREYLHWLITDIPEATAANFGNEIIPYKSPQPTVGIHRIIFVLFRQPQRGLATQISGRENFNTMQFAESHNLDTSPVAVVYFNCQRERGSGGRRFT